MTWRRQVVSAPFIRLFLLASVAPVTLSCALVTAVTRGSEAVHVLRPRHPSPALPPRIRCTRHAPLRAGDRCDSGFAIPLLPGHASLHSASSRSVHPSRFGARSWLHRVGVRDRTRRVRQSQGSDATRPTIPVPSAFLCEMTRNAEGTSPGLMGSIPIGVRGCLSRALSKQVWQRWFVLRRRFRCGVGVRLFGWGGGCSGFGRGTVGIAPTSRGPGFGPRLGLGFAGLALPVSEPTAPK